jgi:hypothetical protein
MGGRRLDRKWIRPSPIGTNQGVCKERGHREMAFLVAREKTQLRRKRNASPKILPAYSRCRKSAEANTVPTLPSAQIHNTKQISHTDVLFTLRCKRSSGDFWHPVISWLSS